MKIPGQLSLICILLLAGLLLAIPVSAETNATTDLNKPSITVSVFPSTPNVGDTVVISGVAKGGNLTPGVAMWMFAGNYVNITTVPVNDSGFYSYRVNTANLPPAYYYIFVQHPGSDNSFNIDVKGFSGEVVNTRTGAVIFNFTGTGSVNDNAAAIALSNAFNTLGVDDIFVKTGVQLLPSGTGANTTIPTKSGIQETTVAGTVLPTNPVTTTVAGTPVIPVATKAPLSIMSLVVGIGLVIIGTGLWRRD